MTKNAMEQAVDAVLNEWTDPVSAEAIGTAMKQRLRPLCVEPEALEPDGPDGYAVVMDDKTSAPRGYWFTACYVRREPAEMVCKDTHSSRVVPIKFMNNGAQSAAHDESKK